MKVTSRSVLGWLPKDTALRWRFVSRRLSGIDMGGGEGSVLDRGRSHGNSAAGLALSVLLN